MLQATIKFYHMVKRKIHGEDYNAGELWVTSLSKWSTFCHKGDILIQGDVTCILREDGWWDVTDDKGEMRKMLIIEGSFDSPSVFAYAKRILEQMADLKAELKLERAKNIQIEADLELERAKNAHIEAYATL